MEAKSREESRKATDKPVKENFDNRLDMLRQINQEVGKPKPEKKLKEKDTFAANLAKNLAKANAKDV